MLTTARIWWKRRQADHTGHAAGTWRNWPLSLVAHGLRTGEAVRRLQKSGRTSRAGIGTWPAGGHLPWPGVLVPAAERAGPHVVVTPPRGARSGQFLPSTPRPGPGLRELFVPVGGDEVLTASCVGAAAETARPADAEPARWKRTRRSRGRLRQERETCANSAALGDVRDTLAQPTRSLHPRRPASPECSPPPHAWGVGGHATARTPSSAQTAWVVLAPAGSAADSESRSPKLPDGFCHTVRPGEVLMRFGGEPQLRHVRHAHRGLRGSHHRPAGDGQPSMSCPPGHGGR